MIVLREIKRTDKIISAKYYPEGEVNEGYLELNLIDGSVNNHKPDGKYYDNSAPIHVKRKLMELAKLDTVPEESKIMWY